MGTSSPSPPSILGVPTAFAPVEEPQIEPPTTSDDDEPADASGFTLTPPPVLADEPATWEPGEAKADSGQESFSPFDAAPQVRVEEPAPLLAGLDQSPAIETDREDPLSAGSAEWFVAFDGKPEAPEPLSPLVERDDEISDTSTTDSVADAEDIEEVAAAPVVEKGDGTSTIDELVPRSEKHLVFFPAFDELGVAMPVAPRDVRQDRPAAVLMIRIVGVGQREIADAREDRFDPIQPRGVGRREDELHVVVGGPVGHLASLVRREVVEHEVEARGDRVARANVREEQQHFAIALAPVAAHHEPIGFDVVGREVLARAMEPPIRRAQPRRVPDLAPRAPMIRAHFDGPELVETDHPAVRRCRPVERTDAFFLAAKSGSGLSFQVFGRWNEKPWSRRMRPSVVACSSLTTPQRTRWAASFRRDHTVNGRPRSCGRVPTTSRMTLTSSGAYFDGRPDAFRGRSAAKPPALNRRINARTYSSWRYNRPAMARARIPCPEKATTCARRKYAAVFVVFKTRVSRRPAASVSSRTYRHTGTSFGSHVCPYWIRRALKVQDAFRYEALAVEAPSIQQGEVTHEDGIDDAGTSHVPVEPAPAPTWTQRLLDLFGPQEEPRAPVPILSADEETASRAAVISRLESMLQ